MQCGCFKKWEYFTVIVCFNALFFNWMFFRVYYFNELSVPILLNNHCYLP
ncbi:hypothetical protein K661_00814 [Piscirickettsia salmonis LF-89 = ATCC VR-1361]|nr:hypothetical protein K661_00814 [Piscirickettsia salmonis LF-89 = ATCC VR-1361]